jgi:hypothetical protein
LGLDFLNGEGFDAAACVLLLFLDAGAIVELSILVSNKLFLFYDHFMSCCIPWNIASSSFALPSRLLIFQHTTITTKRGLFHINKFAHHS